MNAFIVTQEIGTCYVQCMYLGDRPLYTNTHSQCEELNDFHKRSIFSNEKTKQNHKLNDGTFSFAFVFFSSNFEMKTNLVLFEE